MSDPFEFDASRVKTQMDASYGKQSFVLSYIAADGFNISVRFYPELDDLGSGVEHIEYAFNLRVASLSAHQRLAWIAAWAKEQRTPWTPPDEDVYEAFGS